MRQQYCWLVTCCWKCGWWLQVTVLQCVGWLFTNPLAYGKETLNCEQVQYEYCFYKLCKLMWTSLWRKEEAGWEKGCLLTQCCSWLVLGYHVAARTVHMTLPVPNATTIVIFPYILDVVRCRQIMHRYITIAACPHILCPCTVWIPCNLSNAFLWYDVCMRFTICFAILPPTFPYRHVFFLYTWLIYIYF